MASDGEFKIEKNVPLLSASGRRNGFPFSEMEVGDSFVAPEELRRPLVNAAQRFGKAHNQKFSLRKVADGYRCWRLADPVQS